MTEHGKVVLGSDMLPIAEPHIVGEIISSGTLGLHKREYGPEEWAVPSVRLYAWSDGIVTWTEARS